VLRLDYLSCVLTVASTILVGRRCWEGWLLATVNSLIMCVIGLRTGQLGFIPANIFCIVLSVNNLRTWRDTAAALLISGTRNSDGGDIGFTPQ
jgi:nicotinamide riboside transporter PnuC